MIRPKTQDSREERSRFKVQGARQQISTSNLQPSTLNWFQRGQSILEYAVLVGVIAAALVAMQLYVRRSIQANLKTLENQINAEAM